MKMLILLIALSAFSVAEEVFDTNNLDAKKIEYELDNGRIYNFLNKYKVRDESAITAVVNEYADLIFENIQVLAVRYNLDPFNLTDVDEEFLGSSITLSNGELYGIATINRSDDVAVSYSSNQKLLELHVPIVFSNLTFVYDYEVFVLLIGAKGSIVGKIIDFEMDIKLQFDFDTYHAAIEDIKTTNKGHVSLTFHGNSVVDVVVNILSEFVTTILQPLIGLVIEGKVSDAATSVVNTVNDAIDNIFNPNSTTTLDSFV